MKEYEVKVVIEYWVNVEAENETEACDKGYEEYEDWLHTGTLKDWQAYEKETDEG